MELFMSKKNSENFEASIHNEDYYSAFDKRNLNHSGKYGIWNDSTIGFFTIPSYYFIFHFIN